MKKLLVLALVVVLTLSIAALASASTFDPYVGGRIAWAYVSADDPAFKDAPATYGQGSGLKMLLQGKIKDDATNTWGMIGAKIDGWPGDSGTHEVSNLYDFGINKVGGSNINIWYTNWENQNMKRGQGRIRDMNFGMYHADPMFDHAPGNVIGIDYNSDNVVINFGYCPNKGTTKTLKTAIQTEIDGFGKTPTADQQVTIAGLKALDSSYDVTTNKANEMLAAATFKFDGGDVHLGYWKAGAENTETNLGGSFKLGFGTISADYLSASPKSGDSTSQIQAAVSFDELKFDVTVMSDSKYTFSKGDGGTGYQIRYTGLADGKVTLAYRALTANKTIDEGSNLTDAYIGYKFGIFETRLGAATKGTGDKNGYTYASCYASFW